MRARTPPQATDSVDLLRQDRTGDQAGGTPRGRSWLMPPSA
jgi:hypothetical protein